MNDAPQSQAPMIPVAVTLQGEELVLRLSTPDHAISAQLTIQAALDLARNLLTAGLEHAERQASMRQQAEALADATVRKAAH